MTAAPRRPATAPTDPQQEALPVAPERPVGVPGPDSPDTAAPTTQTHTGGTASVDDPSTVLYSPATAGQVLSESNGQQREAPQLVGSVDDPDPVESIATPAPQPTTSRAGRDLPAAIGVGVGLGIVIIATLVLMKELFVVVVAVALLLGVWEIRQALREKAVNAPLVPVLVGTVAMVWAAYVHGSRGLIAAWVLTCVAVVLVRGAAQLDTAPRDVAGGMFAATYPPLLAGFAVMLVAAPNGVGQTFTFIITAVCSDIFGYAAGVWLGRHPMAPTVSPKKSWEGFAGSVLGCVIAGSLTVHYFLGYAWWVGAVLGVGVATAATIGDLIESLIKRDLGIKDMSDILPGHGGIMDRLDSLVVVAPVVWFVLSQLGGIGS